MRSAAEARDVDNTIADVTRVSRAGDRLFIGPGDLRRADYSPSFIYSLMPDLRPATYFIEMDPGVTTEDGSTPKPTCHQRPSLCFRRSPMPGSSRVPHQAPSATTQRPISRSSSASVLNTAGTSSTRAVDKARTERVGAESRTHEAIRRVAPYALRADAARAGSND